MALEHKLVVCEENDPNRCQGGGPGKQGQCIWLADPGHKYCKRHASGQIESRQARERTNDYRLQKWQARIEEFACSENVYNLKGEIGILRLQIEEIFGMCNDAHELMMYSQRISDLVIKVEKLVTSCAKIEGRQGNLLDKSSALILAGQIVDSISSHVDDPNIVDKISNEIIGLVAKLAGKDIEED